MIVWLKWDGGAEHDFLAMSDERVVFIGELAKGSQIS